MISYALTLMTSNVYVELKLLCLTQVERKLSPHVTEKNVLSPFLDFTGYFWFIDFSYTIIFRCLTSLVVSGYNVIDFNHFSEFRTVLELFAGIS